MTLQPPEPYDPISPDDEQWWYNDRTQEVEHGPQSGAQDRIGPFRTREEAERAVEIVRERSRQWADEED